MSNARTVAVYEHAKFDFSVEAANVFNHRNYQVPNMQIDAPNFGQIPELQTAEGAGPRSLDLLAASTSEACPRRNARANPAVPRGI